jgi:predicted Zn-dependent protease
LAVLAWLTGCAVVPETGRKQLILITPSQEMQLGLTAFNQMKKEVPISKDLAWNAALQKVGRRIAGVATLPNAQWEFVLFGSKELNAFCLPGGKVGVYYGILPVLKDEAGLATVIGHEVAHATAHHGAERISEALLMETGGNIVSAYMQDKDPKHQAAVVTAYGLGTQLLRALPHSRKQESEADYIGLLYMARAGYNPEAAVAFWERFAEVNRRAGSATPWFLRTHPLDEKRIQDLKARLPEAKAQYRPVP